VIKKLRIKFITLSMMALFVLLAGIVAGMNMMNYNAVITESDQTLALLSKNGGRFPEFDGDKNNHKMSPEAPYEARYFSVLISQNGEIILADTGKIKAVNTEQAITYATKILADNKTSGFIDNYRFKCNLEGPNHRITFLDCQRSLDSFQNFLLISAGMAATGYFLFFFVILIFSKKIIQPAAESYEKQKRFITDAGHEIKTPLTIIKADTEVLEMELGENEWLTDIQKQAERLTILTNDLIYLSRMEESNHSLPMIELPFSDLVSETAASFQALAKTQGKSFACKIQPMISLTGNEKALHQLLNILLDNALKYTDEKGNVSLILEKKNKTVQLSVYNTTADLMTKETLALMFDRFYRPDASRNSQTGGYGIGLSVAAAIVKAHQGKIQAKTDNGYSLLMTVILPI